jgi:hypothetical protein
MLPLDMRRFEAVTGGKVPGLSQYKNVIEAMRFLRAREKLEDPALRAYLAPYWLAWSSRKRRKKEILGCRHPKPHSVKLLCEKRGPIIISLILTGQPRPKSTISGAR